MMREYMQRKQASGNQIQSSASRQASAAEVLQSYKKKIVQMQAMNEEELLQGKFDATQREEIEDDELLQAKFDAAQREEDTIPMANNTGMPDNLKNGIESLSGYSMDDVHVHYNSPKPAQLQALAYAQGTDIHIAPGQEQHLPHEAWHVVQQKQGRVQPTTQLQGVNVNDNEGLEKEADAMGGKATAKTIGESQTISDRNSFIVQCFPKKREIITKDAKNGIITTEELLEILNKITEETKPETRRGERDWFTKFVNAPKINGPAAKSDDIANLFFVGDVPLLRMDQNAYIHPVDRKEGFENEDKDRKDTYPELSGKFGQKNRVEEIERAKKIREMIKGGVKFQNIKGKWHDISDDLSEHLYPQGNENRDLGVVAGALFGAETTRSPRTFLSHMMLLDLYETQSYYGGNSDKVLTLSRILNSDGTRFDSKKKKFTDTGLQITIPDRKKSKDITTVKEDSQGSIIGGKAVMASAGTREMGKADITEIINLVQAKEVNTLIRWLDMQIGISSFRNMTKQLALIVIRNLINRRINTYDLMNRKMKK